MNIEIRHRCGRTTTWWAPDAGGYVRQTTDERPGTLGRQPTIDGVTLMCGPSEESLRRAVRRYLRHLRSDKGLGGRSYYCSCGLERGHNGGLR